MHVDPHHHLKPHSIYLLLDYCLSFHQDEASISARDVILLFCLSQSSAWHITDAQ